MDSLTFAALISTGRASWSLFRLRLGAVSVALLALVAGAPGSGLAQLPAINACGSIHADTEWAAGNVYVLNNCSVVVAATATLTLRPGVIVKIAGSHDRIVVNGRLRILGADAAPVAITSLRDDSYGGDTNGDGGATQPAHGDWGWITFNAGSFGEFSNAFIGYGGVGSSGYTEWAMVKTASSAVTLDRVTIARSWSHGLYAENASPMVVDSHFADNGLRGGYGLLFRGLDPTAPLVIQRTSFLATGGRAGLLELNSPGHGPILVEDNIAAGGTSGLTVRGTLRNSLDWSSPDLVVVISGLTVADEGEFILRAGAVAKFTDSHDQLVVSGSFRAEGTAQLPVALTSIRDDSHGGDTNGDGAATVPAQGDWGWITFNAGAHGDLQNAFIGYGGVGSSGYTEWAMVKTASSDVTLRGCTVAYSWSHGVYAAGASPAIVDSHFVGNGINAGYGILVRGVDPAETLTIRASSFVASGGRAGMLDLANAAQAPIVVEGNLAVGGTSGFTLRGTLTGTLDWNSPELPIVIAGLTVANSGDLLLRAGSVVKFAGLHDQLVVLGSLRAEGTEQAPIALTSMRDDARGGDTNSDGAATVPARGDWGWIVFNEGGRGTIRNAFIGYGGVGTSGYTEWAMVKAYGHSNLTLENVALQYSWSEGLFADSSSVLLRGTVADNPFGIRNRTPAKGLVDARRAWWGHPSGPLHRTTNPTGLGNEVTDGVLFFPWAIDANGTVPSRVRVVGPTWVSPGDTATYAIDYYIEKSIENAVLVVALPQSAAYVPDSSTGVYRHDRHEIFWPLGTLAAESEGKLAFDLEHAWGQPPQSEANVAGLLLGDGVPSALDADSYLSYASILARESTPLTAGELAAERAAYPDLDDLLNDLVGDGYRLVDASRILLTNNDLLTKVILVNRDRNGTAFVDRNGSTVVAVIATPESVTLRDPSGSAVFDLETHALALGGTWGSSTARIAPATEATFSNCMSNCLAQNTANFLERTRARLSSIAACRRWLWEGIAGAETECLKSLKRLPYGVIDVYYSVNLSTCLGTCSIDPRLHFCVEDDVTCYPDVGLGTGSWVLVCDRATGRLARPKFERCARGEPCIQSVGCYARALAAGRVSGKLSSDVRIPRDPNAKLGTDGEVVPGEVLTYTVTYENEGAGRAHGVYVRDELGPEFDVSTLDLLGDGDFAESTRSIIWEIGELAPKGSPGSTGERSFRVRLRPDLPAGTVISNQAVVYFPSVPEETPTNIVVNVVRQLVAVPQKIATTVAQPVDITLSGADVSGAALTFAIDDDVANGTLSGVAPSLTYTPYPNFTGQDRFTFVVSNGVSRSRPAVITVLVNPSAVDTIAPEVAWTSPVDGRVLVDPPSEPIFTDSLGPVYAPSVQVGFSEAMEPSTLTSDTVYLVNPLGRHVAASIVWDGSDNRVVLRPREAFGPGRYEATVAADASDASGNPLLSKHSWTFSVGQAVACTGDCDGDGQVTVDEIIRGVNIALGVAALEQCPAFDATRDGLVTIDEIVTGVTRALSGC